MFSMVGKYYNEKTGNPAPTLEQTRLISSRIMSRVDVNDDNIITEKEFV